LQMSNAGKSCKIEAIATLCKNPAGRFRAAMLPVAVRAC
jgi:hypothetical protein